MELNSINHRVKSKKIRVGRGIGSGKGKTSGRGHKGQKSRSGVAIKSFEGGQMPLYRRLPKRGFNPLNKEIFGLINLSIIQNLIDAKKILPDDIVDIEKLKKINCIKKRIKKIKILGNGEIKDKINFKTDSISVSAKTKIEKVGGTVVLIKK